MRHSKAILGTTEGQHAPAVPLCSTLFRSKREPRHFTIISNRWFSGGSMVTDDKKEPYCGLSIVKDTLTEARRVIMVMTFNDDSSASRPPPSSPSIPSKCVRQFMSPILLSAETHNFPSGVAPFPGAETGTGGRIRDVQAMNANVTASTVGYSVGALNIPGDELPWEETPSGRGC